MKITKYILTGVLLSATIFCVFIISMVSAEDGSITDQQIQLIKNNCVSNKNTLNQLHSSDALLRVNMGQAYEAMSTKLMVRFNNRLGNNNLTNLNLVNANNNFGVILDTFRLDYISYEEQLTAAINIDCQKQPISFYDAVSSARSKRELLHADVQRLNQALDQYQSDFEVFKQDYKTAAEGIQR